MKKFLLGAVGLLALSFAAPASAADLAARPYTKAPPMIAAAYDWSGFYLGVNGGWGSSRNCFTNTAIAGIAVPPVGEGCHDATGGTAGGQVGYRWQSGAFVFGLEAQGNWADFRGSNPSLAALGATNRTRIDAFGLFTGQVGYAWNNTLLYVKGGAAVTDNRYEGLLTGTGTVIDRASSTRWGGTGGRAIRSSPTAQPGCGTPRPARCTQCSRGTSARSTSPHSARTAAASSPHPRIAPPAFGTWRAARRSFRCTGTRTRSKPPASRATCNRS